MRTYLQTSLLIGCVALGAIDPACAEDNSKSKFKTTGENRRVALVLPHAPQAVKVAPTAAASKAVSSSSNYVNASLDSSNSANDYMEVSATTSITPISSGSRPPGSHISGPAEMPTSVIEVFCRGVDKAGRFGRDCNKTVSQLIAWVVVSMQPSSTLTPAASPSMMTKERHFKLQTPKHEDRLHNGVF